MVQQAAYPEGRDMRSAVRRCAFAGAGRVAAQADKANYDESKVPHYRLPEPLVGNDGRRVTSVGEWESRRDREILPLFRSQMYGYVPAPEVPLSTEYTVLSEEEALDGRAIRRQVRIRFVRPATGRSRPIGRMCWC